MPIQKNPTPKPIKVPEENTTAISVTAKDEAEAKKRIAESYLSPEMNAARLTLAFNPTSSLDLVEVAGKLAEHARAANDGDLSHAEAMLLNQAHALQAMFVKLAERAQNETGIPQIQCLMGLALRAQTQCRATLQTLAEVKFPKQATFIRQANIAHQQQVNNGTAPPHDPHPRARGKPSRLHGTNYWRTNAMTRKASGWTPQRRARQAGMIRNWRPWEAATGPRSADGKASPTVAMVITRALVAGPRDRSSLGRETATYQPSLRCTDPRARDSSNAPVAMPCVLAGRNRRGSLARTLDERGG